MIGHVVKWYLEDIGEYDVWGVARRLESKGKIINLDVVDTDKLVTYLQRESFDIVINCVGLLNQKAEENPHLAIWLNSYFPHLLALYGKIYGFRLIHISTDCVFSGKSGEYREHDLKDGVGYYAQSRALGEVINQADLTFRTSVIGPELKQDGIGLFHWFMGQGESIIGFAEAYWSGVTTIELAKAVKHAIEQGLTGLCNLTSNTKVSKYHLLNQLNTVFRQSKIIITPNSDYQIDKSLISTRTDFNYVVPDYPTMIGEMKQWMIDYKLMYGHYKLSH